NLQAAVPSAFDERFGRREHEEQVHDMPESCEQVAACLIRIGGKAVETKTIDEQVRDAAALGLARHVTVEFLVDNLHLVSGARRAVLVVGPQGAVIEQLFAPDVWTDDGEVAPTHAELAGERSLQRPQGAFSRGRRALGVHYHGLFLRWQQSITFRCDRRPDTGLDKPTDLLAPEIVPGEVRRDRYDELVASPDAAVLHDQRR